MRPFGLREEGSRSFLKKRTQKIFSFLVLFFKKERRPFGCLDSLTRLS
jgi:hypothetical protein